jgi:hypothetical protein
VNGAGMNGSHVKKASGQGSAQSARSRDGTSHIKMTDQKLEIICSRIFKKKTPDYGTFFIISR